MLSPRPHGPSLSVNSRGSMATSPRSGCRISILAMVQLRIVWQEQTMGGLRPETRRFLLAEKPLYLPTRASAGTILIREWQGREYTVTVHADGVEFGGQRFRSLTDVAFRITGQKRVPVPLSSACGNPLRDSDNCAARPTPASPRKKDSDQDFNSLQAQRTRRVRLSFTQSA